MKINPIYVLLVMTLLFNKVEICVGQQEKQAKPEKLVQLDNLEDISFPLPEDWEFHRNPGTLPEGFIGFAGEMKRPDVTVTVWNYAVASYEEFVSLFKRDLQTFGNISDIRMELTDTLINGITIQNDRKFRWIGKHFRKNGKLRMIAVGSADETYDERYEFLKDIFNSIQEN